MKRGTIEHPKTIMLASLLNIEKFAAAGILECLWHFTGRYAPRGDIGKHSEKAISNYLGWEKDPKTLVSALIQSGWIDEHEECRLVIHDWPDHADDSVKKFLYRHKLRFFDGSKPYAKISTKSRQRRDMSRNVETESRLPEPVPEPISEPVPVSFVKSKKKKSFPEDFFVTPEMRQWAEELGAQKIESETENFRDHHVARASVFSDWTAAWRTWMRNSIKFSKGGLNGKAENRARTSLETFEDYRKKRDSIEAEKAQQIELRQGN